MYSYGRFWPWIFILFVLLQIGDGLSTYILSVITSLGSEVEANPFAKHLFRAIGVVPGLLILKIGCILAYLFVYKAMMSEKLSEVRFVKVRFIKIAFILVVLTGIAVNIYNWYLVYYVLTAW